LQEEGRKDFPYTISTLPKGEGAIGSNKQLHAEEIMNRLSSGGNQEGGIDTQPQPFWLLPSGPYLHPKLMHEQFNENYGGISRPYELLYRTSAVSRARCR